MNVERLKLMQTMLGEVVAGTWKPVKTSLQVNDNSESPNYSVMLNTEKENLDFNLCTWVASKYTTKKYVCGFTACAVGHAILDKRFNKLGLLFGTDGVPKFDNTYNWEAVNKFFDIDGPTSERLFDDRYYSLNIKGNSLVNQIVRRIEFLIKTGVEDFEYHDKINEWYSLDKNLKFRKLIK